MKTGVWVLLILSLFFSGCSDAFRSNVAGDSVNVVPETFENPDIDDEDSNLPTQTPPPPQVEEKTSPKATEKPKAEKPLEKPSTVAKKDPSRIMYYAQKIMETEGRKLGTACNFYVHRVLQAAGFPYHIYMANEFDTYAQKYFKHYKAEDFYRDTSDAEEKRLKEYIWSYPQRTPFIANWTRAGVHGHIALFERIEDKLVIYQSSLGTKLPRKDQTSPEILLNGYRRRQLTVFSEMTAK